MSTSTIKVKHPEYGDEVESIEDKLFCNIKSKEYDPNKLICKNSDTQDEINTWYRIGEWIGTVLHYSIVFMLDFLYYSAIVSFYLICILIGFVAAILSVCFDSAKK